MLIKTHNPEQAFRLFSSEEGLPQPGSLTLSAINRQVVSRVEEHFEAQTEVVGQILLLFGPDLAGIATQVAGRAAVVDLARRLLEYRYLLEGYSQQDLPREVESLLNRLHLFLTELAQQYPFLLNRPQTRHNCLLNFYTDPAQRPFVEYMAGPAFVYLIKRREGLQEVSKNYNHSLTSVLQPARDLARYFATHCPPSYREVYQDERLGWELLHRLEAYFRSLPNRQLPGQPRAESTVERDVALTKAMLGIPYLGQQTERRRLLVRSDYQRQPALFPEVFVPFDDAELPDAAWEPSPSPSPNEVQAQPPTEVASENLDLELASYLPGFTSFVGEKEAVADANLEILPYPQAVATTSGVVSEALALARENLPRPERYVRLNHLQDRATLEQHPAEWDSNLIPPLVLGLALVAPFTFATSPVPGLDAPAEREPGVEDDPVKSRIRVSFVPPDKLELEQLERLLFLELALTTGREPLSLLQMEIKPWTALSKASCSAGQLVYVPFHNTIYTVPGSLRGLPRIFKEAPDREKEPGRYADWKKLVEITHRSYRPAQEIMALALHPATRHLLACYYRRRLAESNEPEPLKFFRMAEQTAGEVPLKPRQLEARLLEPINHYLKKVLPLEPPLSFNRLARTGWVYLVKEGGLGPALAHLQSGQLKPELNARLHYVGVDRATFETRVNAAQEVILHKLAQVQAEACPSARKRVPERGQERTEEGEQTVRFSELARRLGVYNTTHPVFNRKPSLASQVPAVDVFYGTGFCPYSEMLQALTGVLLQDYARLPQFYRASSLELEQVSYNLLVYLCAYLTAVCCGVRKSELVLTTLSGLDLAHDPALLSLNGKRDRFNTEPRSLPLPAGLARLWEVVLYLRNRLLPTRRDGSAQALYIFSELSSSGKRSKPTSPSPSSSSQSQEEEKEKKEESLQPLSAEQLWHFLEKAAASLQLRDFLFRFHSFRQNLWYFLRQRGAEEEVVEYLLGHQSAGSEILHPFAGRDLPSLYRHILPHLEALLESLGISEPVITALVCRDYQGLGQLLPQPVEAPFYDDWVLPAEESALKLEAEVEEAAQSEGGRADRLVAQTEIIREDEEV